ncbi:MAG: class I SAM-dependent methyltransferase [Pseudomonadota bacterium]
MSTEQGLAAHYGSEPFLARIDDALTGMGVDPNAPSLEQLKPVDEFHTGGLEATEAFLGPMNIPAGTEVLDIGCGIGGTARYLANRFGAQVTGVDLTPDYVHAATELSRRLGLDDKLRFIEGSALDLPVASTSFDLATMFHVGMNIAEKAKLFAEVANALRPGGRFAVFDIMRGDGDGEISYPAPWSPDAAHSFVAPPDEYREAATSAGLELLHERDRADFAREFFARVTKATAENGPPPIGLHLLMGEEAPLRYGNVVAAANAGVAAPWEMVFRKPS